MQVSDLVLVESKSARDDQLSGMSDDRAQEILGKVKTLMFAVVKGESLVTTEQVSDFYECSDSTIRNLVKAHRSEFESDGLKTLRGEDLKDVRRVTRRTSNKSINAHQSIVWTPRSALRLGMLLTQSEVAKTVRTTILNFVEYAGVQLQIPFEQPKLSEDPEITKLRLQIELARETKVVKLAEIQCRMSEINLQREQMRKTTKDKPCKAASVPGEITPVMQRVIELALETGKVIDRHLVSKRWVKTAKQSREVLQDLAEQGYGVIVREGRVSISLLALKQAEGA